MAQISALEATVQLKSPAKVFSILKSQNQKIANASDNIHDVRLDEGDWETPGSVKIWKGTIDGKEEVFKERTEVDEANKTVTRVAVGGNARELYKSFKSTTKVENNGTVKLRIEYEKLKEDVPPPNKYLQFVANLLKDIDEKSV